MHTRSRLAVALCLVLASFAVAPLARARQPMPAKAPASLQLVESVPEASVYGEPGVPRTAEVWLKMIQGAQRSIDIAAFYVVDRPGSQLSPVLAALEGRARAGVQVRLLVDASFLRMKENQPAVDRLRGVPHVEVRELPMDKLTGGVLHAKYMIVDDSSVFVGSQNWDWRALEQIHEIGARVDDARFAQSFAAAFALGWDAAAHPDLPKLAQQAARPLDVAPASANDPVILSYADQPVVAFPAFSPPSLLPHGLSAEQPALVQMIDSARHVLRVQVMTLSAIRSYGAKGWWPEIDNALRDAAARGVDVRIIVADWALREPMQSYLKSLAVLPHVTVKFSHLPEAPEGFIPYARVEHAKYAIADEREAYVGTGNWEASYFNDTVDASLFVQGETPAHTLISIFDRDWNGPYVNLLEPGKVYQAPKNH